MGGASKEAREGAHQWRTQGGAAHHPVCAPFACPVCAQRWVARMARAQNGGWWETGRCVCPSFFACGEQAQVERRGMQATGGRGDAQTGGAHWQGGGEGGMPVAHLRSHTPFARRGRGAWTARVEWCNLPSMPVFLCFIS